MNPSASTQNTLALIGRALIALLFVPAGFSKIAAFAGVTGYIASKGVPLPRWPPPLRLRWSWAWACWCWWVGKRAGPRWPSPSSRW
jgi:uncharacterized membrane protein YphA (DoxX/SURF4 family)